MDLPGAFHFAEERTAFGLQRVQPLPHGRVRLLGKAAACLADGNQLALIVVTANYALLPLDDFDLQPVATPLLRIRTAAALGNNAFQFALCRGFKQRFAVSDVMVGVADEAARRLDGSQ